MFLETHFLYLVINWFMSHAVANDIIILSYHYNVMFSEMESVYGKT